MYYFTVRCDIQPGREEDLDRFLNEKAKPHWLAQAGVTEFHVYGDALVGFPERTIMIAVEDLARLQAILDSPERKALRTELQRYVTGTQSQIQEVLI